MAAAAHLVATVVLVPYVMLALGFLLLGHAISQGSLGGFLLALVDIFVWMVPWGLLALAAVLAAVAGLYFHPVTRVLASAALAVLAVATLVVLVAVPTGWPDMGQLAFLVPCAFVAVVGVSNLRGG